MRSLVAALLLGSSLVGPGTAVAQVSGLGPAASSEVVHLDAECSRLRAELDRSNAEIATLKRSGRGVRDDYRLRARMADAEALARLLTAAETRLRQLRGAAPPPTLAPAQPVTPVPGDGPVELEAKADLLADQARRLVAQAETLSRAAGQARSRQLLRRRAGQLERDPFAGLDVAKRNMIIGVPRTRGADLNDPTPSLDRSSRGDNFAGPGVEGAQSGAATAPPAAGAAAPMAGAAPPAAPPAAAAPPRAEGDAPAPSVQQPVFAPQLRTLLDPATLAEIQRLEATGARPSDPAALERAAAALRQRAQALDAQAKALRAKTLPSR